MATADDVAGEVFGTNAPTGHHDTVMFENGPAGLRYVGHTMQDKLSHTVHEVTLFLEGRALDHEALQAFIANPARKDTTLGHAINAASLARVNYLILQKIAAKVGADISAVK